MIRDCNSVWVITVYIHGGKYSSSRQGGWELYQTLVADNTTKYVYPWRTSVCDNQAPVIFFARWNFVSVTGTRQYPLWHEQNQGHGDRYTAELSTLEGGHICFRSVLTTRNVVGACVNFSSYCCVQKYVNILLTPVYLCRGDGSFIISPQGEDMLCFRIVPSAGNSAVE